MKIIKNIFLLLILIFSASETKPADWQPLSWTNASSGKTYASFLFNGLGDSVTGKVFIDKESIIKHNSLSNSSTYIINLSKYLNRQQKEWSYKFPRNTKSLKYTLIYTCKPLYGFEVEVWAYSEAMAKGKATKVHSGDNENEDSSKFFSDGDHLNVVDSTCELTNKLNVPSSTKNETKLTDRSQEKKIQTSIEEKKEVSTSTTSPNLWELHSVMIIHFTLVLILFFTLRNVGILKKVGPLLKSYLFGFIFVLLWMISYVYLENFLTDIFGKNIKSSDWSGLYLFLGPFPFYYWAKNVVKQAQQEYLGSPQGQYDQLYKILIDISGISDRVARTILDQYPSFHKLHRVSIEKMCEIPGVGKNLAAAIKARLINLSN